MHEDHEPDPILHGATGRTVGLMAPREATNASRTNALTETAYREEFEYHERFVADADADLDGARG